MINLILSDSRRSLIYLKELFKNKIEINKIILYSKKKGDLFKYIKRKKRLNLLISCKTNDVNSEIINKSLNLLNSKLNLISTYPGEIVKNISLLKKRLLHSHSGDLPKFRGSTTLYYSIILNKKIYVTIFEMKKKIDEGKIHYKKFFNYPKNFNDIEKNFDDKIRVLTIIEYLKSKKTYQKSYYKKSYLPYYVAHPIIRQILSHKRHLKRTSIQFSKFFIKT
jgi:hypothetical protein